MDRNIDRVVMALLLSGVLLAVVTAFFLPALHVRSPIGHCMGSRVGRRCRS